ncbi:DNA translocase FtsK [Acetobacter fallax]|uniref:DNA translocase FtsK n=1 Tax=Acetobacter fallax TaxID=1737473 RepID=A0ABX0K6F5_9PROT|nr:DNA translocase FtsK [Acetobacter fallax]NHO31332.1 cell division protein FtsK [Acetobacter fallax]NHO34889.1 cell division protein FtsK [Acetobacter fallax]
MARLSRLTTPDLSSPALKTSLRRRGDEVGGIVLWVLALALAATFWSYDPLDPSSNVATSRLATNLLGWPGAWVADMLIQGFGLATAIPVIALAAWGWRIFRHRGLSVFILRAIALGCLLPVCSALFASIPLLITAIHAPAWPADSGIGGGIGSTTARAALAAGTSAIGPAGEVIIWLLGLVLAFLLGVLAFGLDRREWHAIGKTAAAGGLFLGRQPGRLARSIIARQRRDAGGGVTTMGAYENARVHNGAESEDTSYGRQSWTPRRSDSASDAAVTSVSRRGMVARGNDSQRRENPSPAPAVSRYSSDAANAETGNALALIAPPAESLPANRPRGRMAVSVPSEAEEDAPVISLPGPAAERQQEHADAPVARKPETPAVTAPETTMRPPEPGQRPVVPAQAEASGDIRTDDGSKKSLLSRLFGGRGEAETEGASASPSKRAGRGAPPAGGTGWVLPPVSLLRTVPESRAEAGPSREMLEANARLLETVLADFGVQGTIVDLHPGPVVTLYELEPAPGIRSARVIGLADDVARSLSVLSVRIATVPGRNVIGIEVPNAVRETVYLSELFNRPEWTGSSGRLELALGKDIAGESVFSDLAKMPHLLVAGTTGSGKSVGINSMILSLLFRHSPDECRLIMIDPKVLELSIYDGIPHLLTPVVTEPPKAVAALKWVVREMDRRYRSMSHLQVRNIAGYNERAAQVRDRGEEVTRRVQTGYDPETGNPIFEEQSLTLEPLPFIVVVIDEMADLMMTAGKEIDAAVQRLAQKARAAGIHVIMATQRPSVDVITGTIKANFPTRISFQVISKFDSRTILGEQGAEQLLGQGDMLFMQGGGRVTRVHGPFVADSEVEAVVAFLQEQGEPIYDEDVISEREDEAASGPFDAGTGSDGDSSLYDKAVAIVIREGKASTSFVQRHLSIGYNRAAKLIEQMEKNGIVSGADHVGRRKVLIGRGADD